jgi:hypothetical protein
MSNRLSIGARIDRNRAATGQAETALVEIAKLMPEADRARRRELRRKAGQLRRTLWPLRIVGLLFWLLDKR